jgi:hypothetical protein
VRLDLEAAGYGGYLSLPRSGPLGRGLLHVPDLISIKLVYRPRL